MTEPAAWKRVGCGRPALLRVELYGPTSLEHARYLCVSHVSELVARATLVGLVPYRLPGRSMESKRCGEGYDFPPIVSWGGAGNSAAQV
ncbi:hypothetical protein ACI2K4_24380 [Micromonospora sp. NPDC050397]|uniref:hypothetical protein n=1 Tax=Micromonospora sp. NPDC050397 TaxID=3364279 RepID=UPI00384AB1A5